MSEVKLIGAWPSPYVWRAMIALNLKSIEYEFLEEQIGSKSQLLLQSNPVYKKIPVLIHKDKPICESMIIVQYIDEVWTTGPSILPSDPYDLAIARFWATYIDDKWLPSLSAIGKAEGEEAKAAATEQMKAGLQLLEEAFEKCSKGKEFFGGDTIGYLDIVFGSFVGWLPMAENLQGVKIFEEKKIPLLTGWSKRFCSHRAVKDVLPEMEKLMEFAKCLRPQMKTHPSPNEPNTA